MSEIVNRDEWMSGALFEETTGGEKEKSRPLGRFIAMRNIFLCDHFEEYGGSIGALFYSASVTETLVLLHLLLYVERYT